MRDPDSIEEELAKLSPVYLKRDVLDTARCATPIVPASYFDMELAGTIAGILMDIRCK